MLKRCRSNPCWASHKGDRSFGGTSLNEEFDAAVVAALLVLGKIAGRKLTPLTVIMKAFAAQPVLGAACVCTGTVFGIDFHPRTLIVFRHLALLGGA